MELILSPWHSPVRNCALEEYMVTERHDDVLLLYRNTPSVILGRNQTVAAEIDGDFCRAHGIEVVRRLSGGGAVYHDLGNINYAFVSNKEASPVLDRDFLRPVVTLLQVLGVKATTGKRKELLAGGRKISGTASHVTRNRHLFLCPLSTVPPNVKWPIGIHFLHPNYYKTTFRLTFATLMVSILPPKFCPTY